jgi:MYXO-CTERM domain-containing protein
VIVKRFNVSKILGSTVLALSLATLPTVLPASAQTTTTTDSTTTDRNYSDGDWGLLGLLGLFGLFGRKSRKADDNVAYRDPNAVGSSSSRSNY